MQLTNEEEKGLNGSYGSTLAAAYRILVAIGEATEAERLVNSYERMGVIASFTCIPYEIFSMPRRTTVSFAESNAAIFSNSMLDLMTNKESALSALASSVTGKATSSGLRVAEQRQANLSIRSTFRPKTELDWGLLGYFAGKMVGEDCINFEGIDQPDILSAKSLSAAMGTSGSCGMFTVGQKNGKQLIRYEPSNAMSVKDELNTSQSGDLIILGSPQLGMNDLSYLEGLLEGKKLSKDCMIFCAREVHRIASSRGIVNRLEKSGCRFFCDSCSCFTPLVDKKETESAITNSVKAAYYLNRFNRVKVCLKNLKTIVDEFSA